MSKAKRDIAILVIISLILYAVIYYNFVLVDAIEKINDINSQIEIAEKKKQALENDLKNLEQLERSLEMKTVQNERLEHYLLNEANISDNIDYIDKLIKLFDNKITEANVSEPSKNVSEKTKSEYYEFKIDLKAILAYDQTMNLINYLEGGNHKVKITRFNMQHANNANTSNLPGGQNNATNDSYAIEMTINLYSMSLSNIDKIYEYSRHNFLKHTPRDEDGVIFAPISLVSSTTNVSDKTKTSITEDVEKKFSSNRDIEIWVESFFVGGPNFRVYGKGLPISIGFKTKQKADVKITFNKEAYNVNVVDSAGYTYKLDGKTPNNDINLYIRSNFSYAIKENLNLGANIQIINNSGKSIKLTFKDDSKCIVLMDRNGNKITDKNETEKVFIL